MFGKISETAEFLKSFTEIVPEIGIILGTGLGALANEIENPQQIPYSKIPNFPVSTVEGHSGQLIFGKLSGKSVVAMQGRFHYYEGYTLKEVTFPVRVLKMLGIKSLFISNAAGGMNPNFKVGQIMFINDHIDLFPDNPLRGKNLDELGPRFPDMSQPYDFELLKKAKEIAEKNNIEFAEGVYAGLSGPTFETPSEYRYIHLIGADAVGMSTVPEVIVARHAGIPCFAISVITDLGVEGKVQEVSHEEVQEVARKTEPKLTLLIKELVLSV